MFTRVRLNYLRILRNKTQKRDMHTFCKTRISRDLHKRRENMAFTPKRSFWGAPPPPDFDPQKDYYKILGVKSESTQAEIKSRYIKVAQEMHPDKNPNADQDKFKEITAAYNLLSNQDKRKQYDEMRKYGSPFGDSNPGSTYGNNQNPYSDGFNPFGQGFRPGGSQQDKKSKSKNNQDFKDFFKNKGSGFNSGPGFGNGPNFKGFEDFLKAMKDNMNKKAQQRQDFYNQYNQNNQYSQYNQQNNSNKTSDQKKKEEDEYFKNYYQEFNSYPKNFRFRFFVNFFFIFFTIFFISRLIANRGRRESMEELYQRQIIQDSYDKGVRFAGMGGSPPAQQGGYSYGNQGNQINSLQNLQAVPRFYDPHANQYLQDDRNRQQPGFYGR